jgi:glutamate-1-semialdehyde 2,1-aminomutase
MKNDEIILTNHGSGQNLYKKAKLIIPGGGQLLSKRPELFLPEFWPTYYSKAKGCEIWDLDNNKYIDMSTMGIGSCILGYADDEVDNAVIDTIKKGSMSSLIAPEEVELAELLIDIHPWADMVRYARGGGEAMAIAVRIARAKTKKDIILFSGYHGWHDWYLSANLSNDSSLDGQLLPGLSPIGVARGMKGTSYPFYYNNKEEFLKLVMNYESKIAGVVLEAVRGSNPDDGFFEIIQEETQRLHIPLIIDEVTSGFRLTCGGAHKALNINPDIAVFAKGIANGYPMAAIIGKSKYMDAAQDSFISSTFWTDRIGPVAALATIKKMIKNNVQDHLINCGRQIQKGWIDIAEKNEVKVNINGIFPLSHISFIDKPFVLKTIFIQEMLKRGFIVKDSYYASFSHQQRHIDEYLLALDEVFKIIGNSIKEGTSESLLVGPICQSGFKRLA